jgi:hypothetical protein
MLVVEAVVCAQEVRLVLVDLVEVLMEQQHQFHLQQQIT